MASGGGLGTMNTIELLISLIRSFGLLTIMVFLYSEILRWGGGPSWLRRIIPGVLFGYLFRLALIFVAVYVVKDAGWISLPALGTSIIVTHLGLLVWELKYVAASLAYPGLKPARP